jgi:hypothetical protein
VYDRALKLEFNADSIPLSAALNTRDDSLSCVATRSSRVERDKNEIPIVNMTTMSRRMMTPIWPD